MEVRDKAHADYVKGMKYKEIAEKYGISVNTIKSWRQRNNWQRKELKKGAPKGKKGAPFSNGNAVGNCGGPGGPERNQKAVTHGLFAKYLPPETADLVKAIENKSAIDILWDNICIKYAAILRAQKIMYVKDADDLTKVLKRQKDSHGDNSISWEKEYELQFAWDKQAVFLQAQARAMGTLNHMIKQYEEMCRFGQADEEQRLRIAKLKAEVAAVESNHDDADDVQIIDDSGDDDEED